MMVMVRTIVSQHISAQRTNTVYPIWTKFGMDILLDPSNKRVKAFLVLLKIQDVCRRHYGELGNWL